MIHQLRHGSHAIAKIDDEWSVVFALVGENKPLVVKYSDIMEEFVDQHDVLRKDLWKPKGFGQNNW